MVQNYFGIRRKDKSQEVGAQDDERTQHTKRSTRKKMYTAVHAKKACNNQF